MLRQALAPTSPVAFDPVFRPFLARRARRERVGASEIRRVFGSSVAGGVLVVR